MTKTVLHIDNVSKLYRLGQVGTGTLAHDLNRWWAKVRGKEDPFLKIGETNRQDVHGQSEYVWALKDINLEVKQGEVLGIIGKNGAGKSTLLKILARVTGPTTGQVKIKGRIGSLLEVGTGFHPELTGRENIFLNGAILGMTRAEVRAKFDAIVDFAGIERYIDTPVKRYSSGMYVRLAFAVAAFLEPEILIVDEVLAVGDAEFQDKAIGKMQDVSKGEGRTVLFVSHNLSSVNKLTQRAILLHDGSIIKEGQTADVIDFYRKKQGNIGSYKYFQANKKNGVESIIIETSTGTSTHFFGGELKIKLTANFNQPQHNVAVAFQIFNESGISILNPLITNDKINWVKNGRGEISCIIPNLKLFQGKYFITVHLGDAGTKQHIETIEDSCYFEVVMDNLHSDYGWRKGAAIYLEKSYWKTNNAIYEAPF